MAQRVFLIETALPAETATSLLGSINSLAQRFASWARANLGCDQTAALYEQLDRHSNAQLHNRGLSRRTLAWDIYDSSRYFA